MPAEKTIFLYLVFLIIQRNAMAQGNTIPPVKEPVFRKDSFDIRNYGAIPNQTSPGNTTAINEAISVCHAKGGGIVIVPAGNWITGPLILKDNVNLHLQKNALLQFSKNFDDYNLIETNWEGQPQMRNQSPISAFNATNIAITGLGIIDGNGHVWRSVSRQNQTADQWKKLIRQGGIVTEDGTAWYPSRQSLKGSKLSSPGLLVPGREKKFYSSFKDYLRPDLVMFQNCRQILIEGVTFVNPPAWNIHLLLSYDIAVRNITIKSDWWAQNTDGVDVESCKSVLIDNCSFDVGDDGICIKSGRDEAGRKRGVSTENVWVKNCTVYKAHGGFVIGSEMSGGVKNLLVEDCTFIGTDIGLRFKTRRGRGGTVENITIRNIGMKDIVEDAVLFDMFYSASDNETNMDYSFQAVTEKTPQFKNFLISNIFCTSAARAIFIRGLPEMPVQDLQFTNLFITSREGINLSDVNNISFKDVAVTPASEKPLVNILNGKNIVFENTLLQHNLRLLFLIRGNRSDGIKIIHKQSKSISGKIGLGKGVSKKAWSEVRL